ncbi:MAG: 3-dehydroquinate synthase [Lachnospiraceae bacterium]|nr:3-dehydroquinate synthase [Lachnospiraceae bacterium]
MLQGKLDVFFEGKPGYDILLEQSYADLKGRLCTMGLSNRKVCIVTDTNVAKYHLDDVVKCIEGAVGKVVTFSFAAGEERKNLDTVQTLYAFLIEEGFDRGDVLAALGGGVVGDLTGFAAATYLRGIRFFQLPTSLLAMVDSSIGGKTGVDFKAYKNMVGAFYMPQFVYMNITALKTLPEREYRSGFGEIIKHGLIKDRELYNWLDRNRKGLLGLSPELVTEMVYRSLLVKKMVVERDPKEKGERSLLNFGHTLGHAVEKLKGFSLLHGECVSLGMAAALQISVRRGNLEAEETEGILQTLSSFGLPVITEGLKASDLVKVAMKDKKMDAGQIRFILLRTVGEAYADMTVTQKEMEQAAEFLLGGGNL